MLAFTNHHCLERQKLFKPRYIHVYRKIYAIYIKIKIYADKDNANIYSCV